MEKRTEVRKLLACITAALLVACVVQNTQAMNDSMSSFEKLLCWRDGMSRLDGARKEDQQDSEDESYKEAPSLDELLGYHERENELACIAAIETNNYLGLKRLLNIYGEWREGSGSWQNPSILIRPLILIKARTIEMFKIMIDAGIDPKEICESGPAQYRRKSLIEILKLCLGDGHPDFKALINYMYQKKLFMGFRGSKGYFAAREEERKREADRLKKEFNAEIQRFADEKALRLYAKMQERWEEKQREEQAEQAERERKRLAQPRPQEQIYSV